MRQALYLSGAVTVKKPFNGNKVYGEHAAWIIDDGKGHVIPFYPIGARAFESESVPGIAFLADITIPSEIEEGNEYTYIFVKKGVPFNERNKWTASVVAGAADTAETIATKVAKYVNDNKGLGLTAEASGANITLSEEKTFTDYEILLADYAVKGSVEIGAHAVSPILDTNGIEELLSKAAADSGFEYTNNDNSVNVLYPGYGYAGMLANEDASGEEPTWHVLTIFQAEPRLAAKPLDTPVNQVIQLFTTNASNYSTVKEAIANPTNDIVNPGVKSQD